MKTNKLIITLATFFGIQFLIFGQTDLNYILIPKGCMYSSCTPTLPFKIHLMKPVNIDAKFDASFTQSCYYISSHTGWNKLYRLDDLSDERSLRLGWRTNQLTNQFEIGLYAHINGEIESLSMEYFPDFNDYNTYYMRMKYNGMYVRAGDNSYCIKRNIFNSSAWYSLSTARGAFFGDPEKAPHGIDMWVKNESWDINSDYWDQGSNKGFGESIFYEGESYSVIASNSIKAPLVNTHNSSKYTIIEGGANVSFVAGENIILHPGFSAKSGSLFKAFILQKDKPDSLNFNAQKANLPPLNSIIHDSTKNIAFINGDIVNLGFPKLFDNINKNPISIFPNPNKGSFYIELLNIEGKSSKFYYLTDLFGNVIIPKSRIQGGRTLIDIYSYPQGLYLIYVFGDNFNFIKKICKN